MSDQNENHINNLQNISLIPDIKSFLNKTIMAPVVKDLL